MTGTIAELRLLLERAAQQRPHLTSRLEKAAFLLLLRPIRELSNDVWLVGAEDGLRYYAVRKGECECSDYLRHGAGHPCKHRLALFLHRALGDKACRRREEKREVARQSDRGPAAASARDRRGG